MIEPGPVRERRTRLTYILLFRVAVLSLLLAGRLIEEATAPEGVAVGGWGLGLVVLAYASTIALSLWLRRATTYEVVDRVAAAQIVFDLVACTALVQLTGGVESQFFFVYLIVVGASGLL